MQKNSYDPDELNMMFGGRDFTRIRNGKPSDYALMIPLVESPDGPAVVFEVRGSSIEQGGEICIPGGRIEEGESAGEAAVRETVEELALQKDQVRLIAPMHRLIAFGGSEICSYLGCLKDYRNSFSKTEVDHVFQIPVKKLLQMKPLTASGEMRFVPGEGFPFELVPGGRDYPFATVPRRMFFYETPYGVIWGLTASFIYHFLKEWEKTTNEQ